MRRLQAEPGRHIVDAASPPRESALATWLAARRARAMRRHLEVLDRELARLERLLADEFGIDATGPLLAAHAGLVAQRARLSAGLAHITPSTASTQPPK